MCKLLQVEVSKTKIGTHNELENAGLVVTPYGHFVSFRRIVIEPEIVCLALLQSLIFFFMCVFLCVHRERKFDQVTIQQAENNLRLQHTIKLVLTHTCAHGCTDMYN